MGDGSSPLTRGKQTGLRISLEIGGLIPTHAGKTSTPIMTHVSDRAHPHSRGENDNVARLAAITRGSSPLTRGKRVRGRRTRMDTGLIPTHAGKTPSVAVRRGTARAHPHSRGENGRLRASACVRWGSSPLTRGKLGPSGDCAHECGLIPTHAGKTRIPGWPSRAPRAHPHSRGENDGYLDDVTCHGGSSPLTRGKLQAPGSAQRRAGLIPTHAGKTR